MPYAPRPDDGRVRHKFLAATNWAAVIAEYARIPLREVEKLPLEDYLLLRRDAVIDRLSRTESGIEYLNDAWMREQTEPDLDGLRKIVGGDGRI